MRKGWPVWIGITWISLVANVEAGEQKFLFTWPCYGAATCDSTDSTHLETPEVAEIYAYRVPEHDTLHVGDLNGIGKRCQPDSFILALEDSVPYAGVLLFVRDQAGNRSCMSNQWLGAFPAIQRQPGLRGQYYDDRLLTSFFAERVDSTINFDWDYDAPMPGMGVETFSIRWEGYIRTDIGGPITFEMQVEDGFRAWVGTMYHDNFGIFDEHTSPWTVEMPTMTDVPFRLEYTANNGDAMAQLWWTRPGRAREVVPASAFWK